MIISYIITHISSTEYDIFALFQSAPESTFKTDRDETLTRHDFIPRFMREINLKALAQLLHAKLACTKCLASEKNQIRQCLKCSRIDNFQPIEIKHWRGRPWFIRVSNLKVLAQFLYAKLACIKYPISSGTDRQTDRRTSSTLYPLVFTGDNQIFPSYLSNPAKAR